MKNFKCNLTQRMFCVMLAIAVVFSGLCIPQNAKTVEAASPVVEQAISWAISIANDNSHGYSMTSRWGPDYGDPTTYLTIALSTNSNNYGKWSNSEYDQLVGQVGVESDVNKRWQEMKDAEKILLDDYAYIPVFEKGAATLQNMKVKNLVIKPCRIISFEYVEKTE